MDDGDPQTDGAHGRGTFFAPPERATPATLLAELATVVGHPVISTVLESFCGQVLVLNRHRQILAANSEFKEALAACGMDDFVGRRPGEALGCDHASEGPAGCGTSRACAHCGAVAAILAAQCCGASSCEECWIGMRRKEKRESVEFRAKATPLLLGGVDVVVLALQDISDQKRRRVLEQTLLHDARNLLGGILTWSEVLKLEVSDEGISSIHALAVQLRDHLAGHSLLLQAEKGELKVRRSELDLPALARSIGDTFSRHPRGERKNLVVSFPSGAVVPASDQTLVLRILSNMVANALEASPDGATVRVEYTSSGGFATFTVRNPGVIAPEVAPRIFQRSFSTKAEPGHGLGTYSMRLFAEQYLEGRVAFTSSAEAGTAFTLTLPCA